MTMDGTDVFAASENGKVYGMGSNSTWEYIGKPDVDVNVRAIAWCNGRLFVGTCEWTGRVYQYQGNATWKDIGVKASYCITEVTTDGTMQSTNCRTLGIEFLNRLQFILVF